MFSTIVFNYLFFISYIESNRSALRAETIQNGLNLFIEKEIPAADLFIDKNGITWLENNEELTINGNFYEVVKIEQVKGKTILFLIEDEKENEMFSSFFCAEKEINRLMCDIVKLFCDLQLNQITSPDFDKLSSIDIEIPRSGSILSYPEYHFKIIKPPCFPA